MILTTGGRAVGATSTRSCPRSSANANASSMASTPNCSPSLPITRTGLIRIWRFTLTLFSRSLVDSGCLLYGEKRKTPRGAGCPQQHRIGPWGPEEKRIGTRSHAVCSGWRALGLSLLCPLILADLRPKSKGKLPIAHCPSQKGCGASIARECWLLSPFSMGNGQSAICLCCSMGEEACHHSSGRRCSPTDICRRDARLATPHPASRHRTAPRPSSHTSCPWCSGCW